MENDQSKREDLIRDNFKKIQINLDKLITDIKSNIIDPQILEDIRKNLKYTRKLRQNWQNLQNSTPINIDSFIMPIDKLIIFRRLLVVDDKIIRILALKIIRYNLEFFPSIGDMMKRKMFPIIICKVFEDHKYAAFEERLEVLYMVYILIYILL